jgi:hypothetical protein
MAAMAGMSYQVALLPWGYTGGRPPSWKFRMLGAKSADGPADAFNAWRQLPEVPYVILSLEYSRSSFQFTAPENFSRDGEMDEESGRLHWRTESPRSSFCPLWVEPMTPPVFQLDAAIVEGGARLSAYSMAGEARASGIFSLKSRGDHALRLLLQDLPLTDMERSHARWIKLGGGPPEFGDGGGPPGLAPGQKQLAAWLRDEWGFQPAAARKRPRRT